MLKKISLSEQAYNKLVKKIISGKYPAGTRLTEEMLCAEFGISRTPVRDAISKLMGDGLVQPLPKRGCRVCDLDSQAIRELFECRSRLEQIALESSILRIPEKKLAELKLLLRKKGTLEEMRKNSLDADAKLHALISEHCANRYVKSILRQLFTQTLPYRNYRNYDEKQSALSRERLKLVDAVLERDYGKAASLLDAHIMNGCP